jgi:hypothetical protein
MFCNIRPKFHNVHPRGNKKRPWQKVQCSDSDCGTVITSSSQIARGNGWYRIPPEYTGNAFMPHMAFQKSVHGAHNFRAGVQRSQMQSMGWQASRSTEWEKSTKYQYLKLEKLYRGRTFYKKRISEQRSIEKSRYHTFLLVKESGMEILRSNAGF